MSLFISRRGTIGALLSGSLAPISASAGPAVSLELGRLIAKHDRLNLRLDGEHGSHLGYVTACGAARARIVAHPAVALPDILAKARCLGRLEGVDDLERDARENAVRGYCYLDCMRDNLAADLIRYAEAQRCV